MNVSKKLDDVLASPWILWGISLMAAVFMWFYVMDTGEPQNERRKFLCELEYRNVAPQFDVKSTVREIEVEVEAAEAVMNRLKYDSLVCELDLRGLSSGKYRETVRVTVPQNVQLISLSPSEVDIELIRLAGRVFPVEVALPQDIPAGRYLEAVEVIPKELNIKGTERDLAKIGSVSIAPTFQELETGKELLLPVKINQSEPFEDEVTLEPAQVKMNATLVTGLPRKKVAVNVRLNGKPSSDYAVRSVTTDPAEVMLQGDKNKLDAVSAVDTETVDISNLSADQTIVVPLRPPKDRGVSILDATSVRLSIHLEPIQAQKQLSGLSIVIEGAPAGKWAVSPAAVDVTIEASPSRMETVDIESLELRVFVDVSNIFLRQAILPVRAEVVSDGFRVVKIEPSTVTVSAAGE